MDKELEIMQRATVANAQGVEKLTQVYVDER